MIITMDGPAGSGKSTAARQVAKALGIAFLDTGATYRAATLKAMTDRLDLTDASAVAEVARTMDLVMRQTPTGLQVLLDGRDVSEAIRTQAVTANSRYAAQPAEVREVLVGLQRRLGAALGSFVAEGRDQGSVVFPHADIKFFVVASPDVRAKRRCLELRQRGEEADEQTVLQDILDRDYRDSTRAAAPLVKPEGAIEVDTDGKTIDEVTAELVRLVEERR